MFSYSISERYWGCEWETTTETGEMNYEGEFAWLGAMYQNIGDIFLVVSSAVFLLGAGFAVAYFLSL